MSALVIEKVETEENSESFYSAEVSLSDSDGNEIVEKCSNGIVENTGQCFSSKNSSEYLNDVSEIREPNEAIENDMKTDYNHCTVENSKLSKSLSMSAPVVDKEAAVDSSHVSDKTPLLNKEFSTAGSSSDLNTEGGNETSETSCETSYIGDSDHSSLNNMLITSQARENLMIPGSVRVPIVGHEVMEARSKFTVFKIHVMVEDDDVGWFIFRRYSDFVHLNDQLNVLFPNFRLSLPPKRWFRSNFDFDFLEERLLGLQAFVNNVTGHRDICNSKPVRDFFCFDDPPGPHDNLEESRAQCEGMEETVYLLRNELSEKDTEIHLLTEELDLYKNQVQLLTNRLSELNRRSSFERSGSVKHHSANDGGHCDINALLGSGDKLLVNKLDTVGNPKSPELRRHQKISTTDTQSSDRGLPVSIPETEDLNTSGS